MTAQDRFDAEMERRDLRRLNAGSVAQVRRLLRHPETAQEILFERLLLGCVALDEQETDNRWDLWEMLLTAYRCCQDALDERREQMHVAEIERLTTDPEYALSKRRLAALNQRSGQAHLEHERRGSQVPPPPTDNRQPQLIRRKR